MPQSSFLSLRETIRASGETRREDANALRRARTELVETRAATQKTITDSRELMAEADAIIARR